VIVPSADWNELFRKVPWLCNGYPGHGHAAPVSVVLDGGRLRLERPHRTAYAAPIDGRFLDWTQGLPKGHPAFSILVNPGYLAELLTATLYSATPVGYTGRHRNYWPPCVRRRSID
jgi:hypothetical protein